MPSKKRLALLLVVILLVAFNAIAQDPVTVRFTQWIPVDSERSLTFLAIADEYMAANPGVNIEFEFITFADYTTALPLQLSGSNPPDAGWLPENVAPTWLQSGILADMAGALTTDAEYDYADLASAAMGLWTSGDGIYGVPFSTSPFLLIYNRDLFAEAGMDAPDVMIEKGEYTWDNLAVALKAIRDTTGIAGLQSINGALYNGERVWHTVIPFIRAYGGDAWDADNQCLLNSPESVAGVQKFHDMIFVDGSVEAPGEVVDFFTGTAAVLMGQLSRVGPLADASFGWDIAPLPDGPAGPAAVIGQAAIVVFNNSPNRDVAIDFVKFLTNKENTLKIAVYFPPIRASALATDVLYDANPTISAESMKTSVIDPTLTGKVLPAHPNFPTIDLTSRAFWDQLWVADADVQAVMDQMCGAIQPLLDR
jgi:multiple sugar transport system substrate-binding protein